MENTLILCPGNPMNCMHFEEYDRALRLEKQRKNSTRFPPVVYLHAEHTFWGV